MMTYAHLINKMTKFLVRQIRILVWKYGLYKLGFKLEFFVKLFDVLAHTESCYLIQSSYFKIFNCLC